MWTAVRLPMAADFRDLNLGLARSFARGLWVPWRPFKRTSGGEVSHPYMGDAKWSLYKTWIPLRFNSYLMGPATIHNFNGMQISLNSLKSAIEFKMFVLDNKPEEFSFLTSPTIDYGCRRSRGVTFTAVRLWGPGSNPGQGRNLKTKISASGAPQGGEGMSPVQGEAN